MSTRAQENGTRRRSPLTTGTEKTDDIGRLVITDATTRPESDDTAQCARPAPGATDRETQQRAGYERHRKPEL